MPKLSVVINTKNVAKTLENALKSVEFADEVVVVDMMSSDQTVKIARKYTSRVFQHKDVGYVEPARNFAIKKAKGDWILVLDADEEVGPDLAELITKIVNDEVGDVLKADCYYLPRRNIIFGRWIKHTGWWPDYVLRLFKAGQVEWSDQIHSIPITSGIVKELPAKSELALIHHNYQSVEQFIDRLNHYSSIQAQEQAGESVLELELASKFFNSFSQEFMARLFARQGIADGAHGMALSLLQATSEAVVQMKAWQQAGFKATLTDRPSVLRSLKQFQRDLNYWIADWQVNSNSGWRRDFWMVRRKFKL